MNVAGSKTVNRFKRLAQFLAMRARDLLQHDGIGVGTGEGSRHLIHAVIAAPKIEGDYPERARASGLRFGSRILHG